MELRSLIHLVIAMEARQFSIFFPHSLYPFLRPDCFWNACPELKTVPEDNLFRSGAGDALVNSNELVHRGMDDSELCALTLKEDLRERGASDLT